MIGSYATLSTYAEIGRAVEPVRIIAHFEYRSEMISPGDIAPVVRIAPDGMNEIINMRWGKLPENQYRHTSQSPFVELLPCLIPITVNTSENLAARDRTSAATNRQQFAAGHWCCLEKDTIPGSVQGHYFYFDFALDTAGTIQIFKSSAAREHWLEDSSRATSVRMLYVIRCLRANE